ncbi:MAG: diaminopimelate decarboxylase [Acidimicrobiia bacterium]
MNPIPAAQTGRGPIPFRLLPDTAAIETDGMLSIGGCRLDELVAEFGTPVFIYDEAHLRARAREAVSAFGDGVAYAAKAFLCKAMAQLAHEEGLHIDVATGGELQVALAAGVPASRLVLHGNNKSTAELAMAMAEGVGRIVIDSFDEMDRIEALVAAGATPPAVLIRITPGIEAHTHEFVQTGQDDSKFGFGLASGAAHEALARAKALPAYNLVGTHMHIGSQVFAVDSFHKAVALLAPTINEFGLPEFSVGGGLGVAYVEEETSSTITEWGAAITSACREAGITASVNAEPGRSIVAAAAVTAYTVGTIKELPGIRTYLAVDGGMSDNPRPVLYGSGYETFLARSPLAARERAVRVVGKHCESGDVLVKEGFVPTDVAVDDILVTPVTGAYGHSMGSNYNKVLRPPVVFVADGKARLVVRRETYDDLLKLDL